MVLTNLKKSGGIVDSNPRLVGFWHAQDTSIAPRSTSPYDWATLHAGSISKVILCIVTDNDKLMDILFQNVYFMHACRHYISDQLE